MPSGFCDEVAGVAPGAARTLERERGMSRTAGFSSPLLLGFDEIERLLDRVSKTTSDGYPPYNIERVRAHDDRPETLRITLAVAGFSENDLEITLEQNQLLIKGRQEEEPGREFLHRGIAARQFQRAFVLAEGMEIAGAVLENGLLSINLTRHEPERIVRKITISSKA
jgi:HSP20 family molecular chaperone IbpA